MYSPKIPDDLIPVLYQAAKAERIPMTKLVDKIVRDYFDSNGRKDGDGSSQVAERPDKNMGRSGKPFGSRVRDRDRVTTDLNPLEGDSLIDETEIDYEAILLAVEEAEYQRLARIEDDKVKYGSKFPENYQGGCNEGTH
jgi:hypothetical protein